MLSPVECIWLHDKPLSFSSPCQPGYLKAIVRATTNSLRWTHIYLSGYFNSRGRQEGSVYSPAYAGSVCLYLCVHACMYAVVYISLVELFICWHPCWESDGIACKKITCHVRYKRQRAFYRAPLYSAPHWLNGNSRRAAGAPRLHIHEGTSQHCVHCKFDLGWLNDWNASVFAWKSSFHFE